MGYYGELGPASLMYLSICVTKIHAWSRCWLWALQVAYPITILLFFLAIKTAVVFWELFAFLNFFVAVGDIVNTSGQ